MDGEVADGRVDQAQLVLLSMQTGRVEAARKHPILVIVGIWLEGRLW